MSLLPILIEAALAAGAEINRIYAEGCDAEEKEDGSPVTIADRHAEAIILERLAAAFPDIPVLAEEEAAAGRIPELGQALLASPGDRKWWLAGTIKRDEYNGGNAAEMHLEDAAPA